ncbi:unnamed protein product [Adineta steineri]|uniref:EF-hand domain-containing protein n=1 Tax=Adineta steineri TaxID=433720 RepID=A0A814SQ41_9BILA|nr:unnamed protein product [Adineta steineri]CAF1299372.1 unnamed protein product [Adineta steineri]
MWYMLLFVLLGSTSLIFGETTTNIERIEERLEQSGNQLPIKGFFEPPEADSYLNNYYVQDAPHKLILTKEITKFIHEWTPRLLALDPTGPYYFSKLSDSSVPEKDLNLLSYLLAIESNRTLDFPFINVVPQTHRNAIPLLSIFRCSEHVYPTSDPFFHNLELMIGPGKTELPVQQYSKTYSQLYCSLYGYPHFILMNQAKQSKLTYNTETLLSQDKLPEIDYYSTDLTPGMCIFVPPEFATGIQFNNSLSLVFTLKKIEKPSSDDERLPCNITGETTLDKIDFAINDEFNMTEIALMVYFYQYLNPPMFDLHYTSETFFNKIQNDRNVSQLIMQWTPELIDLMKITLFKQLDMNNDDKFSIDDYFEVRQANLLQIHSSIYDILEKIRGYAVAQFNELNDKISKFSEQFKSMEFEGNAQEALESLLANLPDQVKERLGESVDLEQVLSNVKDKRPKRPSRNKQRAREDDSSILFDKQDDDEIISNFEQEEEEEITAEPFIDENELHRTDL